MDSSECRVHGSLYDLPGWKDKNANKQKRKAIVKFHAVWNVDGEWIEDFRITPGRLHDCPVARKFEILPNHTYVFDRAYREIEFWKSIVRSDVHFVSRLHNTTRARYKRIKHIKGKEHQDGVLWDGHWEPHPEYFKKHPHDEIRYRHVIYRDQETKKVFDFVTSDFDMPAQEVADIYRSRWAVELLFRWLKGHLNIRKFPTRNPNTIRTQLAIAVLVQLLTQLYRITNQLRCTLWACLRQIRAACAINGLPALAFKHAAAGNSLLEQFTRT
jgi:hypothetical protein